MPAQSSPARLVPTHWTEHRCLPRGEQRYRSRALVVAARETTALLAPLDSATHGCYPATCACEGHPSWLSVCSRYVSPSGRHTYLQNGGRVVRHLPKARARAGLLSETRLAD